VITVYKYQLPTEDYATLTMPMSAELLTVGAQKNQLVLWARVDTEAPPEQRRFRIAGTGHPKVDGEYVGTAQLHEGSFVVHVFELKLPRAQTLAEYLNSL
jgi:hypothetical protein